MLMPVPKGRSLAEVGAMPKAYFTAYLNLFYEGKAKAGTHVSGTIDCRGGKGMGECLPYLSHGSRSYRKRRPQR